MPSSARIGGIDFWRGIVLIAILIDHIPGNFLEHFTPRNFGLSDSAEAFVFLSGLSIGVVYIGRAQRNGAASVVKPCARRALKIYGVHIGLTAGALLLFAAIAALTGVAELLEPHGRALVFQSPLMALGAILLMTHQLGYFNILPLYVVMMALAPFVILLAARSPVLALVLSLIVYIGARTTGFNLPNAPEPGGWFFNPFAWQLIFTCGVVVAKLADARITTVRPWLVAASLAVAVAGAGIVTDGFGMAPGLRSGLEAYGDFGKQNLGVARLVNFAAFAYLALAATQTAAFISGRLGPVGERVGLALQRLGRHSLPIFAAGSMLSAGGQALLTIAAKNEPTKVATVFGLVYTLISIFLLLYLAYRLECTQHRPPSRGERFAPLLSRQLSHWPPSFAR